MSSSGIFSHIYDPLIAPLEELDLRKLRRSSLRGLHGEVLELGVGTARNRSPCPPEVEKLTGIDPDEIMLRRAERRGRAAPFTVELVRAPAEELPFEDESFDAVAVTLVFCTIPDAVWTLEETRRVLKKGGELRLLKHVRMERKPIAWTQVKIAPSGSASPVAATSTGTPSRWCAIRNLKWNGWRDTWMGWCSPPSPANPRTETEDLHEAYEAIGERESVVEPLHA